MGNPVDPKAFVHESAIVDANVILGVGTKIWHFSHVCSGASLGENCSLGQNVYIGPGVQIGHHCKIQNNVSVYEGVTLEDFVFCGPSMVFTNIINPRCKYPQRGAYVKTLVKVGASFGANCTVVCGSIIGKHAFVGAGAVVTGDVPDYALMLGVPAKRIGWMCECGTRLKEGLPQQRCSKCALSYRIIDGMLSQTDA